MNNADDHMRMIKACLKNALTGVNAALTRAVAATFALQMPSGTAADPSYSFSDETTLGFYRAAAGKMAIAGQLTGNGSAEAGSLHMFLVEPTGLGKGGVGTGHRYLELDGSTWANSSFPDLATHLGQGGTSFTLPDAKTTGRFPRSRTATVAAGTAQASQNKTHTHPVVGNTGGLNNAIDHLHSGSGTTGTDYPDHSHGYDRGVVPSSSTGGGAFGVVGTNAAANTGGASARHQHAFSFTTGGADRSLEHTHPVNITSAGGSADGAEARPEALSFVFCIKT
jgi:hypothetical protein